MGLINFDIAAVFIILLNLFLFYSKPHLFIAQNRFFLCLLLVTLGATLTDIFGVITFNHVRSWPIAVTVGINSLFYALQNTIPLVFCLFIMTLSGRLFILRRSAIALLLLPWTASMLIVLSNPLTGFAFSFDGFLTYRRGPGLAALYAVAALYTIISIISLCVHRGKISRHTRMAASLFIPCTVIPVFIQFLKPEILIQDLGIALSELFIMLTVQDFDRFFDRTSGLFNRNGLVVQLEMLTGRKTPFSVFLITLESVEFLRHAIDPEAFRALDRTASEKLFGQSTRNRFAAQLGMGRYALVLAKPSEEEDKAERESLIRQFTKPWAIGDKLLGLSARLCEIHVPDDTDDIQLIFRAQHRLSSPHGEFKRNTMISLQELALADAGRQLRIAYCIQQAIINSGFKVYFQPIVSSETGEVVSAEALVRLYDSELGWISPDEFIPVAEQNGSIHRIGDFVLERSAEFLYSLRADGFKIHYFEVNLSAIQCIQQNLSDRLLAITKRYGLSPADICFEITETAANLSPAAMKKNMDELSAAGFPLAIDDFGTGYSNIYSLTEIPFGTIKLDRSLVTAMVQTVHGRVGMENTVSMFRHLGVTLLAEGVETAAQLSILKEIGVNLIQGYYFSKPLPPEDFVRFLREREPKCT